MVTPRLSGGASRCSWRLAWAYGGSREAGSGSCHKRSRHGRQIAQAAHVQEGGQVSQGEARREALEGRDQEQDSDRAAGQIALRCEGERPDHEVAGSGPTCLGQRVWANVPIASRRAAKGGGLGHNSFGDAMASVIVV